MVTKNPSPVDTASDTPPMGWLDAQSADVRNEYEKLVEKLSDPVMSEDVLDAGQRALKAIWKECRNTPPGPEKGVNGPGDSSPHGEVVFPDPLPLPFMWPGKGWIVEVEILGDGSRSFGLSDSKSGKARGWLREPKKGASA